ncbi:MAG: GntR family transcriptional regulator [Actinomycetota bacterium]
MAPAAGPITRVTLSTQVAERLRDDVLSGALGANTQLNEKELAHAFGVSRGPLREAMQRLIQEGLLRSEPHRGVFVPELTEDDVADVYFVRAAVESAAVRRIVESEGRGEVAAALNGISDQIDAAVRAGRWQDGSELDFAFHRTLVDAAGSKRLSRTYATVQAETRLCLRRLMGGYRRADDLAAEHARLADLIDGAPLDAILDELTRHFGDPIAALRRAEGR